MKQLFLPLFAIAAITVSFTVNSKKEFTPPGTVQINDSLFADVTEISNFGWQEFEMWTAVTYGKNSKEHLAVLPDTLVWRQSLSYNEPYVQYYYRHPAYKEFPVVGISYEQATAYCKWRTARVKTFLSIKKDFKNQNIEYRLPTKTEWEYLASTSTNLLRNNAINEKGMPTINCVRDLDSTSLKKGNKLITANTDVTAPVMSYTKNYLGLYNMLGNVAEMVAEKGISKGGAWRNRPEACRVGKEIEYQKPTAWLGFRCVCVVKKG